MSPHSLPYRLGVGIMLLNADKKIFVGRRIDTRSEAWQMPQGGIDENENPENAAFRELQEETGIQHARILTQTVDWLTYDLPDELVPVIWNGRFRGQKQRWFLMEFTGKDSEINIHAHTPEFLEWKWENAANLPQLIVPFKQKLYRTILEQFSPWLKP